MVKLAMTAVKVLLASLVTGLLLAQFGITATAILNEMGAEPEAVFLAVEKTLLTIIPPIITGALIIVPIWLATYLFRPPRG